MNPGSIRPLSVGEIVDSALKIFTRRFKQMIIAVAVVIVPISVVSTALQLSAPQPDELFNMAPEPDVAAEDIEIVTGEASDFALFAGANLVGLVLSTIGAQLAAGASYRIISGSYLGQETGWKDSLRVAFSKFGSLLWLALLNLLLTLGAMVFLLPGVGLLLAGQTFIGITLIVLGVFATLFAGAFIWARFSVTVPALMVEDVRGVAAMKRSNHLVKGRSWPTFGVLLLANLMVLVVVSIAVGAITFSTALSGAQNSVAAVILTAIVTAIMTVLTTPFVAAVVAVLYFDLRVRKEAFDLELLANSVGVDPADVNPDGGGLPARTPVMEWGVPVEPVVDQGPYSPGGVPSAGPTPTGWTVPPPSSGARPAGSPPPFTQPSTLSQPEVASPQPVEPVEPAAPVQQTPDPPAAPIEPVAPVTPVEPVAQPAPVDPNAVPSSPPPPTIDSGPVVEGHQPPPLA